MRVVHLGVAQLVERRSPKPLAAGSSPVTQANKFSMKEKIYDFINIVFLFLNHLCYNGKW